MKMWEEGIKEGDGEQGAFIGGGGRGRLPPPQNFMDNAPANPLLIVCKKKGGKKAEKEGKGEGKVGQSEKKIKHKCI